MVDRVDQLRYRVALGTLVVLAACSPSEASTREADSVARPGRGSAAGYVDSAMSLAEGLRRFREGLPEVDELTGGASDRDSLIVRFVAAVERGDTATVRAMVVNRAEFAWLYYPISPYTRPPTRQLPALRWFLMLHDSQNGITRVFNRYAGRPLGYVGHACESRAREESEFRFWDRCTITVREGGQAATHRLFGSIIELRGHYKFLSYNNDF